MIYKNYEFEFDMGVGGLNNSNGSNLKPLYLFTNTSNSISNSNSTPILNSKMNSGHRFGENAHMLFGMLGLMSSAIVVFNKMELFSFIHVGMKSL